MPRRYHPALVALHWLIAILLFMALFAGKVALPSLPNSDPDKLVALTIHMGMGVSLLVLMLIRLAVRRFSAHPAPATTGNALLDRIGGLTHWALYALVIGMAVSGMALSVTSGLSDAVSGAGPMPDSFHAYPARAVHGLLSSLLLVLIVLHAAAALWHQFGRRDGLMARMWFGRR